MTRENAIKIVNDYFNKQFVPVDLSEAIDILIAVSPVSQRFVEPSEELDKVAEEYAQDETMSGLAERAFKAGAEWQRESLSHTMLTYAAEVFSGKTLLEDISYSYRQDLADYFRDLAKTAKDE